MIHVYLDPLFLGREWRSKTDEGGGIITALNLRFNPENFSKMILHVWVEIISSYNQLWRFEYLEINRSSSQRNFLISLPTVQQIDRKSESYWSFTWDTCMDNWIVRVLIPRLQLDFIWNVDVQLVLEDFPHLASPFIAEWTNLTMTHCAFCIWHRDVHDNGFNGTIPSMQYLLRKLWVVYTSIVKLQSEDLTLYLLI